MENLISSLVKLRHPFSALLSVGAALTLLIYLVDFTDLSTVEVTIYALAAIALGAGVGGLAARFSEWLWRATRPWRSRQQDEIRRWSTRRRIAALTPDVRELIGRKIDRDPRQSPNLEFAYAELHDAENLVRAELLKAHPSGVHFTLSREAWDVLCDDPAKFGLRRQQQGGYRGNPEYRFHFVGLD